MKSILTIIVIGIILLSGLYYFFQNSNQEVASLISPVSKVLDKPLTKYTIDELSLREFKASKINLTEAVATTSAFTRWLFSFDSDGKKATGVAHIPHTASAANKLPVIVQFRGYVDRQIYTPGEGTKRSAEVFASKGFISLAPDFLGYGGSAMPSQDAFEERFESYLVALNLLASVKSLTMADSLRIGIWGHSNGGQIALTILEISGRLIPTTLWAPVTKPFPYSILYYTDEHEDYGKKMRKKLAEFEKDYNADLYSMTNYLDRINAPILIHQGTADDSVPVVWSEEFVKKVNDLDKDITYYVYPGADHNLVPSWNTAVSRDLEFFKNTLVSP